MYINENCLALALLACSRSGCQDFWRCWNEFCWLKNAYGCCGPCAIGCGPVKGCAPGFGCPPHGRGCAPGFGFPPHGRGCAPGFECPSHGSFCAPGFGFPPSGGFGGKGFAPDPYIGCGPHGTKPSDCPPPKSCSCKFCGCELDGGGFGFKGLGSFFGC